MGAHLVQMHKKFQVNWTKIKGGCQSETKAAQQHSCIDLTLVVVGVFSNYSISQQFDGKIEQYKEPRILFMLASV